MKPSIFIRSRRETLGISQVELARRLTEHGHNTGKGSIGHWERGRNNPPLEDVNFRQALALSLEMDVNEMMQQMGFVVTEDNLSKDAVMAATIIERLPDDARQLAIDYLTLLEKRYTSQT